MFTVAAVRQFSSFSDAYKTAMEAGGKQFMVDMFSGNERQPLVEVTGKDTPDEMPSVMKQIREAKNAPKPPAKPKPERSKKKDDSVL